MISLKRLNALIAEADAHGLEVKMKTDHGRIEFARDGLVLLLRREGSWYGFCQIDLAEFESAKSEDFAVWRGVIDRRLADRVQATGRR